MLLLLLHFPQTALSDRQTLISVFTNIGISNNIHYYHFIVSSSLAPPSPFETGSMVVVVSRSVIMVGPVFGGPRQAKSPGTKESVSIEPLLYIWRCHPPPPPPPSLSFQPGAPYQLASASHQFIYAFVNALLFIRERFLLNLNFLWQSKTFVKKKPNRYTHSKRLTV